MPQLRLHHGDMYIAQLDPTVGGEIRKTRPVVIVSNDAINTHARVVVIAPVTSNVRRASPRHLRSRCRPTKQAPPVLCATMLLTGCVSPPLAQCVQCRTEQNAIGIRLYSIGVTVVNTP